VAGVLVERAGVRDYDGDWGTVCVPERAAAADDLWALVAMKDGLVRDRRTSCMARGECRLQQAKALGGCTQQRASV
jgi:hypothetical protein